MSNLNNIKEVELLAPAGSYEAFIAAINAGADAVYMGIDKYNARTMAKNFNNEEYIKALDYAHKRNVKVYLTLNTLLLDSEIKEALNLVVTLYEHGLDAIIVQDLGFASLIHKVMSDLAMHASTQMSVCNISQVKFLEKIGFTRIVLGRELSIDEIKYIKENTNLEIEVFVHGALCVSLSGQCIMSSMIGDRSANRGNCAQPCRMKYSLYNSSGKIVEKDKYLLSKKDIYGLESLKELKMIGVDAFKIEGRNRTPEYTAGVVSKYRECIDNNYVVKPTYEKELLQLFSRSGKSDGYLNGIRYKKSISLDSPKNTGLYLGEVLEQRGVLVKVKLNEKISMHDGIEIQNNGENISTIVTYIKDEKGNTLNKDIEAGEIVLLGDVKNKVKIGNSIYKTSSSKLNEKYKQYYNSNLYNKRLDYDIMINILKDKKISVIELKSGLEVNIDYIPEKSKTTGVTTAKIEEVFSKTEDTSVKFANMKMNIDDSLFVPVSKLNELRRECVNRLEEIKTVINNVKGMDKKILEVLKLKKNDVLNTLKTHSLYMYKYNSDIDYIVAYASKYNMKLDKIYISAKDFKMYKEDIKKYIGKVKIYFVIPNIVLNNMDKYITNSIEDLVKEKIVSGVVIGNVGYISTCNDLKQKYGIEIVGDYSLNTTNVYTANVYNVYGIDVMTPLFELGVDIKKISTVSKIELVEGLATAMTSRYCLIASFVKNITNKEECKASCKKDNYYIIDSYGKKYDIVSDNNDCIMTLVRNKRKYDEKELQIGSLRNNII